MVMRSPASCILGFIRTVLGSDRSTNGPTDSFQIGSSSMGVEFAANNFRHLFPRTRLGPPF